MDDFDKQSVNPCLKGFPDENIPALFEFALDKLVGI
jgi:hypothetical protein